MRSPTAKRHLDEALREASERHRGLSQVLLRMGALRQTELGIPNANSLPIQVVPGGLPVAPPTMTPGANPLGRLNSPLQAADGTRFFVDGYSAPAGSPEAVPDGTGRGGDILRGLLGLGISAAMGVGTLAVLTPLAGVGVCVCAGMDGGFASGVNLAGSGTVVAAGFGDFAVPVDPMGRGIAIAAGQDTMTVLTPLSGAGVGICAGMGALFLPSLSGAGVGIAAGQDGLTVLTPLSGSGVGVASTSGTLAPLALALAGAGKSVVATSATLSGSFGPVGPPMGDGP